MKQERLFYLFCIFTLLSAIFLIGFGIAHFFKKETLEIILFTIGFTCVLSCVGIIYSPKMKGFWQEKEAGK